MGSVVAPAAHFGGAKLMRADEERALLAHSVLDFAASIREARAAEV